MSIRVSEKNISAANAPKNEWTKGAPSDPFTTRIKDN